MAEKLVVFDLDGTLLDTLEDIRSAVNYALSAWSVPKVEKTKMREYVGQMDAYYKAKGQRRLNTVFFKKDRKKAEKGFIKLKKKLMKNGANLKVLPQGEFTFKSEKRPAAE